MQATSSFLVVAFSVLLQNSFRAMFAGLICYAVILLPVEKEGAESKKENNHENSICKPSVLLRSRVNEEKDILRRLRSKRVREWFMVKKIS